MDNKQHKVCPVEQAGGLDNKFRRWLQHPKKILRPYLKEGMTVLDVGCGPGFFTIDMAEMIGESGKVIAVDLQKGMLDKVEAKIKGTELEKRIELHQCQEDKIGVSQTVDFVLLFYMVHEVPSQEALFSELYEMMNQGGQIFIAEPPFHVPKSAFASMIKIAEDIGFQSMKANKVFLSKSILLRK